MTPATPPTADHPGPSATAPARDAVALGPSCCPGIGQAPLGEDEAGRLAALCKALGDPVRLRLMSIIAASAETCVCDLTGAFAVSAPTISHHLKVLRDNGLVTSERRGTWVYYRARPDTVGLLAALFRA